jgi:hypothetical protein
MLHQIWRDQRVIAFKLMWTLFGLAAANIWPYASLLGSVEKSRGIAGATTFMNLHAIISCPRQSPGVRRLAEVDRRGSNLETC